MTIDKSEKLIQIVCSTDNEFVPYCAAMIDSLINSSDDSEYFINILHGNDIRRERVEQLEMFLASRVQYRLLKIESGDLAAICSPCCTFPKAAYFRLVMHKYLPPELKRVIYLDGDMFIDEDLLELWRIDLRGFAVGAVKVTYINTGHLQRLGLLRSAYFNSGVMVIDLDTWRVDAIGELTLSWLSKNQELVLFADQDALNVILSGRWSVLPDRFNVTTTRLQAFEFDIQRYADIHGRAAIIHFTGRNKPWNYLSTHPYKQRYIECIKRTPWPEAACVDLTPANIIRKYVPKSVLHLIPEDIRRRVLSRRLIG